MRASAPKSRYLESPNISSVAMSRSTCINPETTLRRAFCRIRNCLNSGSGCVSLTHWWETKRALPLSSCQGSLTCRKGLRLGLGLRSKILLQEKVFLQVLADCR